jgi:SagB-type dehydrogenase family enzyme
VRLRRSQTIVLTWDGNRLLFFDCRTRIGVRARSLTVVLLDAFDRWRRPADAYRRLAGFTPSSLDRALQELVRHGLLVREASTDAALEARFLKVWGAWMPEAGFFHFATKDYPYGTNKHLGEAMLRRFLAASPQPPFFKHYRQASRLELRMPRERGDFYQTLMRRRTHRRFGRGDLPLALLSRLLYYTWGVSGFKPTPVVGRLPLKTSPSGGARHSLEVYVVALRVKGLAPGIYHYAADEHALEQVRTGPMAKNAARFCAGQTWARRAAALFVMTSVFPRVMWKYRFARTYRVVLAEAGHFGQTLCLVATQLRLAPFCTMAINETAIETQLGLDGVEESPLYVLGVGLLPRPSVRRREAG